MFYRISEIRSHLQAPLVTLALLLFPPHLWLLPPLKSWTFNLQKKKKNADLWSTAKQITVKIRCACLYINTQIAATYPKVSKTLNKVAWQITATAGWLSSLYSIVLLPKRIPICFSVSYPSLRVSCASQETNPALGICLIGLRILSLLEVRPCLGTGHNFGQ